MNHHTVEFGSILWGKIRDKFGDFFFLWGTILSQFQSRTAANCFVVNCDCGEFEFVLTGNCFKENSCGK
jgi:hypothetical protein